MLQQKWYKHFPVLGIVLKLEVVPSMSVVGQEELVESHIEAQQAPHGEVKAKGETNRYINKDLGKVVRTGHIVKPVSLGHLVARCNNVT